MQYLYRFRLPGIVEGDGHKQLIEASCPDEADVLADILADNMGAICYARIGKVVDIHTHQRTLGELMHSA